MTKPTTIGDFIRERRRILGLRQEDLALAIGRDQSLVSQIENNDRPGYLPPLDVVWALARALACTTEDLLAAAGYLDTVDDDARSDDERLANVLVQIARLGWPEELRDLLRRDVERVWKFARERERSERPEREEDSASA